MLGPIGSNHEHNGYPLTVPLINICFKYLTKDVEIYSIFTIDNLNCLPV